MHGNPNLRQHSLSVEVALAQQGAYLKAQNLWTKDLIAIFELCVFSVFREILLQPLHAKGWDKFLSFFKSKVTRLARLDYLHLYPSATVKKGLEWTFLEVLVKFRRTLCKLARYSCSDFGSLSAKHNALNLRVTSPKRPRMQLDRLGQSNELSGYLLSFSNV